MRSKHQPQPRIHDWYTWVRVSLADSQTHPPAPEEAFNFEANNLERMIATLAAKAVDRAWMPADHIIAVWKGMLEPQEALQGPQEPICHIHEDGRVKYL